MQIDNTERLDFEVYIEGDEGLQQEIGSEFNDSSQGWLKYNQNNRVLSLLPDGNDIGKHYIRINAIDRDGEKTSIAIPIMVFWKNQKPSINTEGIIDKIAAQNQGIKGVEMEVDNSQMKIELMENSNIIFKVPKDIFVDPDLAINPDEELDIKIIRKENENENESLIINNDELSVKINTRGLGVDTPDGYVEWNAKIEGIDKSGEKIEIDILFWLQRVVISPEIELQVGNNRIYDEGTKLLLKNLVSVNANDYPDQKINLKIRQKKNEGQDINLMENEIFEIKPVLESKNIKVWRITGSINEIIERIKNMSLEASSSSTINEVFKIKFEFIVIGDTGMKSEVREVETQFRYDPIPSKPEWIINNKKHEGDKFELNELGNSLRATVDDKGEQLTYRIKIHDTQKFADINIKDRDGNSLGFKDDDVWILSEEQWEKAVIRSKSSNTDKVDLEIQAQSKEVSNGRVALSDSKNIQWQATPIINGEVEAAAEVSENYQVAGKKTNIELTLEIPRPANTAQIRLSIPKDSRVFLGDNEIQKISDNKFDSYFEITLGMENNLVELNSIDITIKTPEMYSGIFKGEYQILASTRTDIMGQTSESEILDKEFEIAKESTVKSFEFEVYQVAKPQS